MDYFDATLVQELKTHRPVLANAYANCKDKHVGFKRCGEYLLGLQLPTKDEDSNLIRVVKDRKYAKYRARFVTVEFIYDINRKTLVKQIDHRWYNFGGWRTNITYTTGQINFPDTYDSSLEVCSHGIHFYLSLEAAICHSLNYWNDHGKKVEFDVPTDVQSIAKYV